MGLGARSVVAAAFDYPSGSTIAAHRHPHGQLVHAASGVMTVNTAAGTWVVPPGRAVWVPPGIEHEIRATGELAMRTVYLRPGAWPEAPAGCRVVAVSPLLRELILRVIEVQRDGDRRAGAEGRLIAVLLDEVQAAEDAPLHLPRPRNTTLAAVTEALRDDPSDSRPLAAWARDVGASERTLARLFRSETGMTFAAWRGQLRLIRALELLADGGSVTEVALAVGYDAPSSFIAMFRRSLGTTPSRYFDRAS